MQNFIEIHQRNPELLSSGGFRPPPPRLDRGIERPRLDRVKSENKNGLVSASVEISLIYSTHTLTYLLHRHWLVQKRQCVEGSIMIRKQKQ